MRIRSFSIDGFKSLKELRMDKITNMNVLIGRNGAGKSNILEAMEMFLRELTPTLDVQQSSVPDYLWPRQHASSPMSFVFEFELGQDEVNLSEDEKKVFPERQQEGHILVIAKNLGRIPAKSWNLITLTFDDVIVCSNGQLSAAAKSPDAPMRKAAVSILNQLMALIKSRFSIIGFDRMVVASGGSLGVRTQAIAPSAVQTIIQTVTSPEPERDEDSYAIQALFKEMTGGDELIVSPSALMVREKANRIPLQNVGVGTQTMIGLLQNLMGRTGIVCIEEPEVHLHAELQRKVLSMIRGMTPSLQVFLTTHSSTLLDDCSYENIWHVYKQGGVTYVRRVTGSDSFRQIAFELGIRPSDVFMSNSILFVEGVTEKVVIPAWAALMGKDFGPPRMSVIPMRGAGKGRYHLAVWNEAARDTGIPRFFLVDGDKAGKEEAKAVAEKKLIEKGKIHVLARTSIEDYYPSEMVAKALVERFSLPPEVLEALEKAAGKSDARSREIERLLSQNTLDEDVVWKTTVASYVAENTKLEQLDIEIRNLILQIDQEMV